MPAANRDASEEFDAMFESPDRNRLAVALENVEFKFDRSGLDATASVGEDVRTGRAWLGVNNAEGDEVLRIARKEGWLPSADLWSLYDPDRFMPIGERSSRMNFDQAVSTAIEEFRRRERP